MADVEKIDCNLYPSLYGDMDYIRSFVDIAIFIFLL